MKYVLTGGAGNITGPLAGKLLEAGHEVTVISRKAANIRSLTDKGVKAAIGSIEDPAFIEKTFEGATAVYTMVPSKFDVVGSWKDYIGSVGKIYADAIRKNRISYVVNLSSVGAHLPDGCGPVSGLHRVEQELDRLEQVHTRHLRPAFFYTNFLSNIAMIRNLNIIGGNYGGGDFKMLLAATTDVADIAFEEMHHLSFSGKSVRYIASDERTTDEIALLLGKAIGKIPLPWVRFSDEQTLSGMLQSGLPEEIARNYTEMGNALQSGMMLEDYGRNRPASLEKTKLEDFARYFAEIYNSQ